MDSDDRENGDSFSTDKVLHLADYDAKSPARIASEMRDYWWSLRRGRAVPSRSDVDPAGLRTTLDYAFILERVAPGAARFRLAGRHLIDLMGMELRGMPLCAFFNPASRGHLSDVLEAVFKAPQIAELDLSSPAGYARPLIDGKMLILPLKSDLGDVTRALGCLATDGEIGTGPRRFDITADQASPVIEGAKVLTPSPSAAGFAEPPAAWTPAPKRPVIREEETPEERRARFRIISND